MRLRLVDRHIKYMSRRVALILCAVLAEMAGAGCSGRSSGVACTSNRDCSRGQTCIAGQCTSGMSQVLQCTRDDQCPLDQYCDLGEHACKDVMISGMMNPPP